MLDSMPSARAERTLRATDRLSALATKQGGRVTRTQVLRCGLSEWQVTRWLRNGRLIWVSEGVYALGHRAETAESPLFDALLQSGEGSALSHATSLWWRDLIRFPPGEIHVSAPGRRRSREGVVVHHPTTVVREWCRGLPVVPVAEGLLGSASMISFAGLRRAVALTDKRGLMSVDEIAALGRSGKRGSLPVRKALAVHMPQLARTRSPLEDRFLLFCERHNIELPIPNHVIAGNEVDAVWPHLKLAVELDGREEHGTPAAVVVDRRRELAIRNAGFELIRYGSEQIDHVPEQTAADLKAVMAKRLSLAGPPRLPRCLEHAHVAR